MNNKIYKQISGRWTFLIACFIILSGCNQEWEGEQYEKYLSFVNTGANKVYLKYEAKGGKKRYKLPVQVSGSEIPKKDIHVSVMLDKDTIADYNYEVFRRREDLYFKELDPKHYDFESWSTVIQAGSTQGDLYVDFSLEGMDNYYNYFLPLQIDPVSDLPANPKKHYKKSLVQVVPFNDFSGRYDVAGEVFFVTKRNEDGEIVESESFELKIRNSFVYDENTICFYAGLTEENAIDRKDYLLYARFIPIDEITGTIEMWCENPDIDFKYYPDECSYLLSEMMDEKQPYLKRKYVTVDIRYSYNDITNPEYPLDYEYYGPMVMERLLNIHMPEEDQIVWD